MRLRRIFSSSHVYQFVALTAAIAISCPPGSSQEVAHEDCDRAGEMCRSGNISASWFRFGWFSYVQKETPGQHASEPHGDVCRSVENQNNRNLYYYWKLGGLFNQALSGHMTDTVCVRATSFSVQPASGTLWFGRTGESTDTEVWRSTAELKREQADRSLLDSRPPEVNWGGGREKTEVTLSQILTRADLVTSVTSPRSYFFFLPLPLSKKNIHVRFNITSEVTKSNLGYIVRTQIRDVTAPASLHVSLQANSINSRLPLRASRRRRFSTGISGTWLRTHLWPQPKPSPSNVSSIDDLYQIEYSPEEPVFVQHHMAISVLESGKEALGMDFSLWSPKRFQ